MRAPSRDPTPPWFRPVQERLSPTITALVIVTAVMFALIHLVKPVGLFAQEHLALRSGALAEGEIWQVASSLFVFLEPWTFFFNLIGLWFVGATIERQLGRSRFLVIFFVPAIVANLAMALVFLVHPSDELFFGYSLSVLAMFVTFGRIYDRTPARILGNLVLEARTLTLILIAFALFSDLLRGSLVALVGDLVALAVGYVVSGGRGAGLRELFSRLGRKSRRRFHVVEGGRQPPKPPRGDKGEGSRSSDYLN